jgi:peptidoglycan hydrolase-like protein with peptidoglycan-binding domain
VGYDRGTATDRRHGRTAAPARPAAAAQRPVPAAVGSGPAGNRAIAGVLGGLTVQREAEVGLPGRPVLKKGSSGPAVKQLQLSLNAVRVQNTPPPAELAEDGQYGDATEAAVRAYQRSHGIGPTGVAGPLTWGSLDGTLGTERAPAAGPDQHAGASAPDAAEQAKILAALNPATAGGAVTWDGAGEDADAARNRADLTARLRSGLETALANFMPRIHRRAAGRRVPMSDYEGAGRQAKRVVDAAFAGLTAAGALTAGQRAGHAALDFTAGTNLLDVTDPAVSPRNAEHMVRWLAGADPGAAEVQRAHGFDFRRSDAEANFFAAEIMGPFIAAHQDDLALMDSFGFNRARPDQSTVLLIPNIEEKPGFSDTAPVGGGMTRAERQQRWRYWQTLVHEYLHTAMHPAFMAAAGGRGVMREGFCEMFTLEVLETWRATAKADGDAALRGGVEGTDADGNLLAGFTADLVPDDDGGGSYAGYVAHAREVRSVAGDAAVKAAFFQGHMELIGLRPDGEAAKPAEHSDDHVVPVPPVVRSVAALSVMTGVPEDAILAVNLQLTPDGPLPATVRVPGCRWHTVVAVTEKTPAGAARATMAETRAQIATQNGVTEADLDRANPGVRWARLQAGDRVLVPAH